MEDMPLFEKEGWTKNLIGLICKCPCEHSEVRGFSLVLVSNMRRNVGGLYSEIKKKCDHRVICVH